MPVGAAVVISPLMLTYIRSSELSSAFGAALCNLFSPFSGEREQLGRGGTVGCENHELSVLLSPDLSCLGHAVIKLSERLLHDSDPVIGVGQLLLELLSRIHMTRNRLRERLRVIFRLVEIPQAARFLAVVFTLLRLQQNHHLLDHGDDLGVINALPAERQSNQLKVGRQNLWSRWRCIRDGLGRVALKSWSASSSALLFRRSSHSDDWLPQLPASFAANSWSAAKDTCVSATSFFRLSTSTARLTSRVSFVSIVDVKMAISSFFAAMSPAWLALRSSSTFWAAARSSDISSFNCFRMPMISPLFGAYPWRSPLDRKDNNVECSLSETFSELMATLRMAEPTRLWRKLLPATPFSRAAMALVSASMLAARSELSASNAEAPLSSRATALAKACLASARDS